DFLEESREIDFGITAEIHPLLLNVSPAEIDILLKPERKKLEIRGKSLTKSGPVLKNEIPIRTFFRWDERKPGFFELDRVAHCGNATKGQFCWTLTATDVYSGWTEERVLLNNAHFWTKQAAADIHSALPFPMYGIDTDNGGEFIKTQLLQWCNDNQIQFTRGRPYRKNDNCLRTSGPS
ncbi:MAG: transposase family protein, partial [Treponema sp.]|nr:transposase family protein [Treponema sp.]